ncbi:DUF4118 domain-containing protein [Methylomonas montana]|uniref:DUF4118 domain-containing protein n=1 Tax=Methylomonas montana TaxID=3058963 RepID=UPI002658DE46|nr:DUF4118 domain-containing protein [Methylomonas montana]WKJ91457.1 DUF4118 domain-containing protein [Methylomonas montana]
MHSQTKQILPIAKAERWHGYAWGVAAPFLCTAIDWPLRHVLGPASILMTFLLGVFLVASRYGRGASITASLLSSPVFAYYFAPPIFSFAISDLQNMVGLAVMIIVANLTSNLLDKARWQAEIARQRENRAEALYRFSRALSDAQNNQTLAMTAVRHIYEEFHTPAVLLFADDHDALSLPSAEPLPCSLPGVDLMAARQAFQLRTILQERNLIYYPLQGSQALLGVLAIRSEPEANLVDPELSALFDTFRNLIAQTLERLNLAGQARDAILQAEAEALRNALLSAISHDLRTPLTRIIGAANALIDSAKDFSADEKQEFYKAVVDEAQRMAELTSKILDMARLSSGEIVLHREWNALEEIVGSALTRLNKYLQDRPVRTQLPGSLPLVWIDAVLLEQVLVNLIENAIKYTPSGSPIDIGAEKAEHGLRLAVSDYGPGIPAGMEEKIFEKFYRATAETQQNGVGLGLALCRAIVEAHGGTINAVNIAGKGAAFFIDLPLHEPPPLNWNEAGIPV